MCKEPGNQLWPLGTHMNCRSPSLETQLLWAHKTTLHYCPQSHSSLWQVLLLSVLFHQTCHWKGHTFHPVWGTMENDDYVCSYQYHLPARYLLGKLKQRVQLTERHCKLPPWTQTLGPKRMKEQQWHRVENTSFFFHQTQQLENTEMICSSRSWKLMS